MAHEIEGNRMAYAGETPWHGLGVHISDPTVLRDAEAFCKAAGLDTTAEKEPMVLAKDGAAVPSKFAVVRQNDRKVLGVVGEDFEILQNIDAARFFSPFLESGAAEMHTGMSLREGTRVCFTAKFLEDSTGEVVPGDAVRQYLMLLHAHDGSLAIVPAFTDVRVVCMNTVRRALASAETKQLKIRHTSGLLVSLEQAQRICDVARRTFEVTLEQYRFLASRSFDGDSLRSFVREAIELPAEAPKGEELSTRTQNKLDTLTGLCLSGIGQDIPGARGTYWAAYNGLTEYATHHAGTKSTTDSDRFDSLLAGSGRAFTDRALTLATSYASRV